MRCWRGKGRTMSRDGVIIFGELIGKLDVLHSLF